MTEPVPPTTQLWELKITASGMVHDADGNLLSGDVPLESTTVLTEDEARTLFGERNDQ